MKSIRDIANLDHFRHAINVVACDTHVNETAREAPDNRVLSSIEKKPDTLRLRLFPQEIKGDDTCPLKTQLL